MKKPNVKVIIVNWKLKDETVRCLYSLEKSTYPCEVVVVDNGSKDGSTNYITDQFPNIEIIELETNIGFGSACNYAIKRLLKQSNFDYVLLLNNDSVIHPEMIGKLVDVAENQPEVGIFGPKVYYGNGPNQNILWYAGARSRKSVLAAADTGRGDIDRGQFDSRLQVDYVFGAAMLIRRSIFQRIGLFDERFFLYLEDLDFCLRTRQAGIPILFVPKAHVYHQGSASTRKDPALRKYHYSRSTILFLRKHNRSLNILLGLVFWILVFIKTAMGDIVKGEISTLNAYFTGLINGLSNNNLDLPEDENSKELISSI